MNGKSKVGLAGRAIFTLRGPDGKVKQQDVVPNIVVEVGRDLMAQLIAGSGGNKVAYLEIGWGTGADTPADYAQTANQGTDQDRKIAVYAHTPGLATFTLTASWGVDEPEATVVPVEELASFNAASGPTMFSRLVRAVMNKDPADTLEITYEFELDTGE